MFPVRIATQQEVQDRTLNPQDDHFAVFYLDPGERLPGDVWPYVKAGREVLVVIRKTKPKAWWSSFIG